MAGKGLVGRLARDKRCSSIEKREGRLVAEDDDFRI